MSGNSSLNAAIKAKQDEFYTQLPDIENELKHYKKHFKDKAVFCNCDDPYESNFFKYFAMNFNALGLKKLIATCYSCSPVAERQLTLFDDDNIQPTKTGVPHKIVITEVADLNGDGATNLSDVEWLLKNDKNVLTRLEGDGDFRSKECVELLNEADIVVTNPPFSLFRDYIAQLLKYDKKFLVIGQQNAIHYVDIFREIKANKLWIGYKFGDMSFQVPDYFEPRETRYWQDETGQKWRSMGNICWFTNLDIIKRHELLDLYKKFDPQEYPIYDNYDAINVDKVANIPMDYYGEMGVPITFMDKYNPDQFEIIDTSTNAMPKGAPYIYGKRIYERILIRKKQ